MQIIYVVAWEYKGGGGFDWYRIEEEAKKAFHVERENESQFSDEHWKAYFFLVETNAQDDQSITDEIEMKLYNSIEQ